MEPVMEVGKPDTAAGADPAAGTPVRNPKRWWILVVLCLSTLVLVVDNMVLTVAVPSLTESLHASAQDTQWILDSYILVFAGFLLTAGSLSDRFGRRRVMIVGLVLFGAASALATFASSPGELIAGRTLMGVGGALIMPSTLSILITVFDEDERRKAMAAWSVVAMVGLVGGPVLGGVMISHFWWGSVFLLNIPIAALAVLAAVVIMPESRGPWRKPDPLGALLSVVGLTAAVWFIIELPKGLTPPVELVTAALAVVGLVSFGLWEAHTPMPMVPMGLFRERNFSGGSFSLTLVQIANGGLLLVLTQYLQFVLDYSPLKASLAFIPLALAALLCNGVGAALATKVGNRAMTVGGLVVLAAAFVLLASISAADGFAKVAVGLFFIGAGAGLAMPAAVAALMGALPPEQAGVSSALNDTIQQTGAALGVAVLGSVVTSRFTAAMPAGAPERARRSIGDAVGVAHGAGDTGLAQSAHHAFITAMSTSFVAGAVGAVAAAVVAYVVIRDQPAPAGQPTPEGVAEPPLAEAVAG